MPFTLPAPVVVEGVEYPYCGVSLITSPGFGETSVSARVVLLLEPYRIGEDGKVYRPTVMTEVTDSEGVTSMMEVADTSKNIGKSYSNAYLEAQGNSAMTSALMAISSGIQGFINSEV